MTINCGAAQFMPVTVRCLEALVEGHLIGLRATCHWGFSSHLFVHSNYEWRSPLGPDWQPISGLSSSVKRPWTSLVPVLVT